MATFHLSHFGTFVHPWVNKPDTKFNAEGLFHVDLDSEGPEAERVANLIEGAAKAHLQKYIEDNEMKPGEAKKWTPYLPFERLEDDDGNPTGVIRFTFKQNAKIPSKKEPSGFKTVTIDIRDSSDQPMKESVWDGSEGRVMFTMRGIEVVGSKLAGVRLDLAKVQVTELKTGSGSGGGGGFGAVEGGFVSKGRTQEPEPDGTQGDDEGGDY